MMETPEEELVYMETIEEEMTEEEMTEDVPIEVVTEDERTLVSRFRTLDIGSNIMSFEMANFHDIVRTLPNNRFKYNISNYEWTPEEALEVLQEYYASGDITELQYFIIQRDYREHYMTHMDFMTMSLT